ncbi:WD40 repeat [Trypanosoma melophagium]|uniref:WD40 repeat n=1 Tax=Trypanosoma melophagium TaxID=715481 RepID=UPI00351A0B9D|nr:WD40 repeat [Trypanosoma melophagium]
MPPKRGPATRGTRRVETPRSARKKPLTASDSVTSRKAAEESAIVPPITNETVAEATESTLILSPPPQIPTEEDDTANESFPLGSTAALSLRDEVIWSDDDENDDEDDVFLFPDAQDLTSEENPESEILRLGTTQKLEESDSSEDEATLNRVGDIPLEWYKDESHYGYDIEGRKLMKSERTALERLLDATDDPNAMRTIYDALHDEKKQLSNADLQMIFNIQRNRTPNASYNMYADVVTDTVEFDPLNHPLARGSGPSKKKFLPADHDMKVIAKMVRRLMKADKDKSEDKDHKKKDDDNTMDELSLLWDDTNVDMDAHTKFKYQNRVPKPKVPPPGTYESYRPPPEYLPSEKAKQRFARLRAIDRKEHFLPQAFDALRHVPFYHHTIQDRYQRCLDLAFFPRAQRTRLVVDPSKLLPDLPDPRDLRPYPERLSFQYKGHTATVRSISVSPNGQFLATGCDDHLVRVYEVLTGRLMKRYDMGAPVQQVEFCPVKTLNILAVAVEYSLVFIVPKFAAHNVVNEHTIRHLRAPGNALPGTNDEHIAGGEVSLGGGGIVQTTMDKDESAHRILQDLHDTEEREKRAEFVDASAQERSAGIVLKIALHGKVKRFTFHARGDYLCALCPKDHVKYRQTVMLQLSKRKVFCPFRKFAEIVTDCKFHPREPLFFLSTTNSVRVYNLLAHKLQRRYKAPGGVTTCLSVHTDGDNFLVGDTTSHTQWYDCDFSDKPYKRMRSHKGVVNAVAYHTNTNAYPLFATAASDGQVHVFHGMVYDDYNKNPLLVPVKILKHRRAVYSVAWHPTLPWVFTSTEDGVVSAWTE